MKPDGTAELIRKNSFSLSSSETSKPGRTCAGRITAIQTVVRIDPGLALEIFPVNLLVIAREAMILEQKSGL